MTRPPWSIFSRSPIVPKNQISCKDGKTSLTGSLHSSQRVEDATEITLKTRELLVALKSAKVPITAVPNENEVAIGSSCRILAEAVKLIPAVMATTVPFRTDQRRSRTSWQECTITQSCDSKYKNVSKR